jgi:hypothetical protein
MRTPVLTLLVASAVGLGASAAPAQQVSKEGDPFDGEVVLADRAYFMPQERAQAKRIANARIHLTRTDPSRSIEFQLARPAQAPVALSDARGRFRAAWTSRDPASALWVQVAGHPITVLFMDRHLGRLVPYPLDVVPGRRLAGTATEAGTGKVLANATLIALTSPCYDLQVSHRAFQFDVTTTDAAGKFVFTSAPDRVERNGERWPIYLHAVDAAGHMRSTSISLGADADAHTDHALEFAPRASIRGTVMLAPNQPAPGARVAITGYGGSDAGFCGTLTQWDAGSVARADARGRFHLLLPGTDHAVAHAWTSAGHVVAKLPATSDGTPHALTLTPQPMRPVRLQFVGPDGQALTGVRFELAWVGDSSKGSTRWWHDESPVTMRTRTTNGEGVVALAAMAQGDWQIHLDHFARLEIVSPAVVTISETSGATLTVRCRPRK